MAGEQRKLHSFALSAFPSSLRRGFKIKRGNEKLTRIGLQNTFVCIDRQASDREDVLRSRWSDGKCASGWHSWERVSIVAVLFSWFIFDCPRTQQRAKDQVNSAPFVYALNIDVRLTRLQGVLFAVSADDAVKNAKLSVSLRFANESAYHQKSVGHFSLF